MLCAPSAWDRNRIFIDWQFGIVCVCVSECILVYVADKNDYGFRNDPDQCVYKAIYTIASVRAFYIYTFL